MKRVIHSFFFVGMLSTSAFAQNSCGETVTSSGGDNGSFSWIIGASTYHLFPTSPTRQSHTNSSSDSKSSSIEISLYPNPTQDLVTLSISGIAIENTSIEIELSDMTGKTLIQKHLHSINDYISLIGYPAGFYFLKITDTSHNVLKVVKVEKIM